MTASPTVQGHGGPARRGAPAVERAAAVLRILADNSEPLSFSELSAASGLPRSSLHDLCQSLVRTGLVERTPEGRYLTGLTLVELARRRLASTDLVGTFQTACRTNGSFSETVVLAVLDGADMVYLSYLDGDRPLAVRYRIGMRLPAAFTASGKAVLSTMSTSAVAELIGPWVDNPNAWGRLKSVDELHKELESTREHGFSIDDEETARGMTCLGAPVFSSHRLEASGAVAVSLVKGSTNWFDTGVRDYVCGLAAEISRLMGAALAHQAWTDRIGARARGEIPSSGIGSAVRS